MTGIEVAVGFLGGWAVHKARRVAVQADAEVDRALASAMDGLHELVSTALGVENPALRELTAEAEQVGAEGAIVPSGPVGQRVQRALEDATERDPVFDADLKRAVQRAQDARDQAAGRATAVGDRATAFHGTTTLQAKDGGVVAVNVGSVTTNPSQPGSHQR